MNEDESFKSYKNEHDNMNKNYIHLVYIILRFKIEFCSKFDNDFVMDNMHFFTDSHKFTRFRGKIVFKGDETYSGVIKKGMTLEQMFEQEDKILEPLDDIVSHHSKTITPANNLDVELNDNVFAKCENISIISCRKSKKKISKKSQSYSSCKIYKKYRSSDRLVKYSVDTVPENDYNDLEYACLNCDPDNQIKCLNCDPDNQIKCLNCDPDNQIEYWRGDYDSDYLDYDEYYWGEPYYAHYY